MAVVLVAAIACARGKAEDWSFIQGVGGIAIRAPYRTKGGVVLPVDCDVSGLRAITLKPTRVNSGLVVRNIRTVRLGTTIYLNVMTTVASSAHTSAACGLAELGDVPTGTYTVIYGNPSAPGAAPAYPVRLGEVEVRP